MLSGYAGMIHTYLYLDKPEIELSRVLKCDVEYYEANNGRNLAKARADGASISKLKSAITEMEEKGVPTACSEYVKRLKTLLEA